MDFPQWIAAYYLMVCKGTHVRNVAAATARGERRSGNWSGRKCQGQFSIILDGTVSPPEGFDPILSDDIIIRVGAALGVRVASEHIIDCRRHWLETHESQQ